MIDDRWTLQGAIQKQIEKERKMNKIDETWWPHKGLMDQIQKEDIGDWAEKQSVFQIVPPLPKASPIKRSLMRIMITQWLP